MANEAEQNPFSLQDLLEQYPREQGSLLQILREVQHANRFVPEAMIPQIANWVRMTTLQVYAVLSFYKELRTVLPGDVLIRFCDGPACHVRGMDQIIRTAEHYLGISLWETTTDGRFTLETYPCNGTCDCAPYLTVNEIPYCGVTPDQVADILQEWGWQAPAAPSTGTEA
jgi:NADH-quinone oxidoreductase subunit E